MSKTKHEIPNIREYMITAVISVNKHFKDIDLQNWSDDRLLMNMHPHSAEFAKKFSKREKETN